MRTLSIVACLAVLGLAGCEKKAAEPKASNPVQPPTKPCPDVNNRDRNDPCSPLYFKKKGSSLPDKDSF